LYHRVTDVKGGWPKTEIGGRVTLKQFRLISRSRFQSQFVAQFRRQMALDRALELNVIFYCAEIFVLSLARDHPIVTMPFCSCAHVSIAHSAVFCAQTSIIAEDKSKIDTRKGKTESAKAESQVNECKSLF
jgi:hypothetical protein